MHSIDAISSTTACGCMGPQNGETLCPCMMRAQQIHKHNGRWVRPAQDLGPVRTLPENEKYGFDWFKPPQERCLHDQFPDDVPLGLVCTCKKCSITC